MKNIEKVLEWLLSNPENMKAFRADIRTVTGKYQLDAEETKILEAVHSKGLGAPELEAAGLADVEAQRSFGWPGPVNPKPK